MFLKFRCKNFRSLRDEQEISLVASSTRTPEKEESLLSTAFEELQVLRCAAIYGANASGKTNILRALQRFGAIVYDSQRSWPPKGKIPAFDPFALDTDSRKSETTFELDFSFSDRLYSYGFSFTAEAFSEEWLIDQTLKERELFRRKTLDGKTLVAFKGRNLSKGGEQAKILEVARLQTRTNSLFLSAAAQSNHEFLLSIYDWITSRFHILSPTFRTSRSYTAESCNNAVRKEQIVSLLRAADVGIVDFEVDEEEMPEEVQSVWQAMVSAAKAAAPKDFEIAGEPPPPLQNITMLHSGVDGKTYSLPMESESAGTRAYFQMLGPILDELEDQGCLLIDEIESSIHPLLARQLVRMFADPTVNKKGAQLIFSTHDTNLLDLELMRRDQFWFAQKNASGVTSLASLSDFVPRVGQDVASAYLHGRYAGTPLLQESSFTKAVSIAE